MTVIQSLKMIEDLLRDILVSSKYAEMDIRKGSDPVNISISLRQIKEDSKIIYHLLDRVTSIND
jgi:hypothetical protein